jgi:hypothetical protein
MPAKVPIRHGTATAYNKCRPKCDKCRQWRTEYVKEYRDKRRNEIRSYNRLYALAMRTLVKRNHDEFITILHDLQDAADRELGRPERA